MICRDRRQRVSVCWYCVFSIQVFSMVFGKLFKLVS